MAGLPYFWRKNPAPMRKNVAIMAGGDSGEYEVSINSSRVILNNIDEEKYRAFIVLVKGSDWKVVLTDQRNFQVDKNSFSFILDEEQIVFDVVFMAIHGRPGEDGRLQGYLDMMNIPYTTCAHDTSALCFNKKFSSRYAKHLGMNVTTTVYLRKGEDIDAKSILEQTSLPCFVKPIRSGSSIGITKVKSIEQLDQAINKAFEEDDEIAIEAFLDGMEVTCGMLQTTKELLVFPLTEVVPVNEFFDYESKYTQGMAQEITPARVDKVTEAMVKETSVFLYSKFSCKGLVRFDYIHTKDGLFFIEVNTVPGLSEASIVPQQARAMGISTKELFTLALEATMEK